MAFRRWLPNPALDEDLAATGLSGERAFAALCAAEDAVGRSCGPCTVCCRTVGIPELDSPPGAPCPELVDAAGSCEDGGCGVYADRPGGCRVYACAWKLGLGDEEHRPDRAGGLLEWMDLDAEFHPFAGYWLFRSTDAGAPTLEGQALLDCLVSLGCVVLFYRGPGQPLTMFYPDGFEDAEAGTAPSWAEEQAGGAMEFRVAYFASYADQLDPELRTQIESGELPFLDPSD